MRSHGRPRGPKYPGGQEGLEPAEKGTSGAERPKTLRKAIAEGARPAGPIPAAHSTGVRHLKVGDYAQPGETEVLFGSDQVSHAGAQFTPTGRGVATTSP